MSIKLGLGNNEGCVLMPRYAISSLKYQQMVLVLSMFIIFIALLFKNMGLYPSVFADEYVYSKLSRLVPLAAANVPDYIYFAIYRITNISGDGFLECARVLNSLFFVVSAPFI